MKLEQVLGGGALLKKIRETGAQKGGLGKR